MKQSEFAALHGVSRKTVTMWKERGWLVFAGDELDVDASNALVKKYRRDGVKAVTQKEEGNSQGNKPRRVTAAAPKVTIQDGESVDQAAERILVATGAEMNLDEARRVKENYLALAAQLEYDRDAGLVVEVADVAKVVGEEYAKARTKLLAIPAEHAPRLHRFKTVVELEDALRGIITNALEELTKDGDVRTA
jgi:hypothetical protein